MIRNENNLVRGGTFLFWACYALIRRRHEKRKEKGKKPLLLQSVPKGSFRGGPIRKTFKISRISSKHTTGEWGR